MHAFDFGNSLTLTGKYLAVSACVRACKQIMHNLIFTLSTFDQKRNNGQNGTHHVFIRLPHKILKCHKMPNKFAAGFRVDCIAAAAVADPICVCMCATEDENKKKNK